MTISFTHHLIGALLLIAASGSSGQVSCNLEVTTVTASTPTTDFALHADGTATHNTTGLMWMRCGLGQTWSGGTCTGYTSIFNWSAALAQGGTSFAGYSDWRLPNINELGSIMEERCYGPTINFTVFPSNPVTSWFWSSSPYVYDSDHAWAIDFYHGIDEIGHKEIEAMVRLVRSSQ